MVETERVMPNGVHLVFCEFTVDEHYSMAKFVMDCMCLSWIDNYPGFHGILWEIFNRYAQGKDMTRQHAVKLADKYERFFDFGLPTFPKFRDGGRLMAPKHLHGDDAVAWLIAEKIRIWREVWEEHYIKNENDPDDHSKNIRTIGGYQKFPHGEPDGVFIRMQAEREEKFWNEVDARQVEYGCSRNEAVVAVSDYMLRAESELQLPDPALDGA